MIRALYIPLSIAFLFLFACSSEEKSDKKTDPKEQKEPKTEIEVDKVRIYAGQPGSAQRPIFQWKLGEAKPSGLEPRLIEYILNQIGVQYEYVSNYPIDGYGDERIQAITTGEADLSIQGITITEARKEKVNFSDPYYVDGLGIMVMSTSEFSSLEDLKGKKVFAYRFSTTYKWAKENLKDCQVISQEDVGLGSHPIELIRKGEISAYMSDYSGLKREKANNLDMRIFPRKYTEEKYGIAVNKEYPKLLAEINKVLAKMKSSGRLEDFTRGYEK